MYKLKRLKLILSALGIVICTQVYSQQGNESNNNQTIEKDTIEVEFFEEVIEEDILEKGFPSGEEEIVDDESTVFFQVENMPVFPGGESALDTFIKDKMEYPAEARSKKISGSVMVQFVVEKSGTVSHIKVAKGVNEILDKEAVRIVSLFPKWQCGTQRTHKLRVGITIPINFEL